MTQVRKITKPQLFYTSIDQSTATYTLLTIYRYRLSMSDNRVGRLKNILTQNFLKKPAAGAGT
jgi:hypothetical protein